MTAAGTRFDIVVVGGLGVGWKMVEEGGGGAGARGVDSSGGGCGVRHAGCWFEWSLVVMNKDADEGIL